MFMIKSITPIAVEDPAEVVLGLEYKVPSPLPLPLPLLLCQYSLFIFRLFGGRHLCHLSVLVLLSDDLMGGEFT